MTLVIIIVSLIFVISVNSQTTLTPPKDCGLNATWSYCHRRCPYSCAMLNDPPHFCPGDCIEGCMCNRGYFGQGGLCVLRRDCNVTVNP
ncbi:venom peptide SjAPI-2 [Leptopilina boulardi]|uniref:venom peptide SjAPI-2 n=1 Tax=Leptopilina boulardi TaxID=63433 RepID=UPI0021F60307|nr:venom peptide SjAPI-2 [Leptopilina boulardi]